MLTLALEGEEKTLLEKAWVFKVVFVFLGKIIYLCKVSFVIQLERTYCISFITLTMFVLRIS